MYIIVAYILIFMSFLIRGMLDVFADRVNLLAHRAVLIDNTNQRRI